ncbi:putative transmembrane protein [Dioscorea sansibarensis]
MTLNTTPVVGISIMFITRLAAPLFIIAVIWFLGFGLVMFSISCCYCCCSWRKYSYSRSAYAFSFIFLILFTCAAIIGCIVMYNGKGKFHSSLRKSSLLVSDSIANAMYILMEIVFTFT